MTHPQGGGGWATLHHIYMKWERRAVEVEKFKSNNESVLAKEGCDASKALSFTRHSQVQWLQCATRQARRLKIFEHTVAPSLGVTNHHVLNLPLPLLPEWAWFERASCSTAVPRKQSKMSNVQRWKSPSESPGYQKNLDKAAQEAGTGQKRSEKQWMQVNVMWLLWDGDAHAFCILLLSRCGLCKQQQKALKR